MTIHSPGRKSHKLLIDGTEVANEPTEVDLVMVARDKHGIKFKDMDYSKPIGPGSCFCIQWRYK